MVTETILELRRETRVKQSRREASRAVQRRYPLRSSEQRRMADSGRARSSIYRREASQETGEVRDQLVEATRRETREMESHCQRTQPQRSSTWIESSTLTG